MNSKTIVPVDEAGRKKLAEEEKKKMEELEANILEQTCSGLCAPGFTSNGSTDGECVPCDITCATCQDNGLVGDKYKCQTCSTCFPYMYSPLSKCMKTCYDEPGYYKVTSKGADGVEKSSFTCDRCQEPCHNCRGDRYNCTQCESAGKTPALFTNRIVLPAEKKGEDLRVIYRGTCYRQCPNGYYIDKSIPDDVRCSKCASPCGTCVDRADYCLSCNGVWLDPRTGVTWQNMTYVFEGNCYDECPQTTAPDMSTLRCLGCGERCNQCGTAKDTCFECVTPDYVVTSTKSDYTAIHMALSQKGMEEELKKAEAAWREEQKYIPKAALFKVGATAEEK